MLSPTQATLILAVPSALTPCAMNTNSTATIVSVHRRYEPTNRLVNLLLLCIMFISIPSLRTIASHILPVASGCIHPAFTGWATALELGLCPNVLASSVGRVIHPPLLLLCQCRVDHPANRSQVATLLNLAEVRRWGFAVCSSAFRPHPLTRSLRLVEPRRRASAGSYNGKTWTR